MSHDISIDPGIGKTNGTGWASWHAKELLIAGLVRPPEVIDLFERARTVVESVPIVSGVCFMEHMQVYGQQRQKGDPNDLVDVAFLEGMLSARCKSVILFTPREWKGQMPDAIVKKRVEKRLDIQEQSRLEAALRSVPASLRHNVYAAVGIGLHAYHRL